MRSSEARALASVVIFAVLQLSGCGGGGSTTGSGNPPPPASTITGVSLSCTPSSVNTGGTSQCTPTVTGTGNFSTAVTLSASAGLIATTGLFTAPSSAATVTVMAISTQDATKSGAATIAVTAVTPPPLGMTINITDFIFWSSDGSLFGGAQFGQANIPAGAEFHMDPLSPFTFPTAPGATFGVTLQTENPYDPETGSIAPTSFGPYDSYVTNPSNGTTSNHLYLPVISRWNDWMGDNGTDEFWMDLADEKVYKFNLASGASDGSVAGGGWRGVVDGSNLIIARHPDVLLGFGVYDSSSGKQVGSLSVNANDQPPIGDITDVAGKNGIAGVSSTTFSDGTTPLTQVITFFNENVMNAPVAQYALSDNTLALGAIAMTKGCVSSSTAATAVVVDMDTPQLVALDVAQDSSASAAPTITQRGLIPLTGFATQDQITEVLPYVRYLATWDGGPNPCEVAYFGPVLNPGNGQAYGFQLTVANLATGKLGIMGTDTSLNVPLTAARMVPDPAGNAVYIANLDQDNATTEVWHVSWTVGSSGNLTFTNTELPGVLPAGTAIYPDAFAWHANGKGDIVQRATRYPVN